MKTIRCLLLTMTLALVSGRGEEWRKVAFIGDADVKSISGVVEVVSGGQERILHPREIAVVGQTLRVWRGAEVVLMMKNSKSLVTRERSRAAAARVGKGRLWSRVGDG